MKLTKKLSVMLAIIIGLGTMTAATTSLAWCPPGSCWQPWRYQHPWNPYWRPWRPWYPYYRVWVPGPGPYYPWYPSCRHVYIQHFCNFNGCYNVPHVWWSC